MWPWRRRSDEDFAEEIQAHIVHETKRLVEDEGLSVSDAKAKAIRSFGNVTASQERFYESSRLLWFDDLKRDLAYSVRSLRTNPGFAAVAVLTLALGIGATTAIYSVVDAILLRPLPFADSERLVRVVENEVGGVSGQIFQRGLSYQQFAEWRARTTTLEDVVGIDPSMPMLVGTDEGTKRLWGARTSANTFSSLGVNAMLGRTLVPSDNANPHVIVLGFDAWTRAFRSDPRIIGRELEVRGRTRESLTIVGVLPRGFEFPTGPMDFYRPFDLSRPPGGLRLIGRLRPGVSLQAAMDEAHLIGTAIRPPRPADARPLPVARFDVQRLKDEVVKALRPALRILLAAVVVVLMIVCANVANLLLARGTARQREIAVRTAIGASRGRIIRQALAECVVLACAGGVLGAQLGAGGVRLVKRLASVDAPGIFHLTFGSTILPRGNEIGVNLSVFGIAFSIAALACLVFGLLPSVQLSRADWTQAMGSRTGGPRRRDAAIRSVLVVSQLVLSTVLLVGAGLLINSFVKLATINKGYDPSNVLALQLIFPGDYAMARKVDTVETVLARLRTHPDVRHAGFSRAGVLIGEEIVYGRFVPRGRTVEEMSSAERPRLRSISEGFLPAMGIRFVAGRDLTGEDASSASPAIVINRRAAAVLFGRDTAVGELVDWQFDTFRLEARVVGVVEELRNESLYQDPFPEVFVHYLQLRDIVQRLNVPPLQQESAALGVLSFAIRTDGTPEGAIEAVTRIVRETDANAGIDALIPLDRLVASSVARQRFYAVLLGIFAIVAALLAAIGIYGILAYAVAQRTQEIGIRIALGAARHAVLALVLRQGLIVTTVGIGLGLAGAVATTRLLESMLFGVTPLDPMTFVVVSLIFVFVAMAASYIPARRAAGVNPIIALRAE